MGGILIKAGQLEHIQLGQVSCQHREGEPGKINAANGQLLPDFLLRAVFPAGLDLNDHLAPGALFDQRRKPLRTLGGGVISGLVVRIGQYKIRRDGLFFAPAARQQADQQADRRQQPEFPAHGYHLKGSIAHPGRAVQA